MIEVTIVGGPHDGEQWAVQRDMNGDVPKSWAVRILDEAPAAYTCEGATSPQSVRTKTLIIPIRLTRNGWVADWNAGMVEEQ